MDAEKMMMRRQIDALVQYATCLADALTETEWENARLKAELEAVKRERDALLHDFKGYVKKQKKVCLLCGNRNKPICNMCEGCDVFEWRGLCKENGGAEE